MSSAKKGPSKKFQPAGWLERFIPVVLILLLIVLVATILFVILSVSGLVG